MLYGLFAALKYMVLSLKDSSLYDCLQRSRQTRFLSKQTRFLSRHTQLLSRRVLSNYEIYCQLQNCWLSWHFPTLK